MYFVIVLLSLMASSLAQLPGNGPCPEQRLMENYQPSEILGQWHGYATYPNCDPRGRCRRTNFIHNGDGSMEIVVKQLSTIPNRFTYTTFTNRADYLDRGVYLITTTVDPRYAAAYVNHTMSFYRTDYTSFLVKGVCVNVGKSSLTWMWALSRRPNPPASVVAQINEALADLGARPELMTKYNQTNCPYTY